MQVFLFGVGLFWRWMWQSLPTCSPLCKWLCYSPYKTPFEIKLALWLALKCGRRDMSDFWASSLLCRSALEFDLVEASYHVRKSGLPSGRSNMESKAPQDALHGKKCRACPQKTASINCHTLWVTPSWMFQAPLSHQRNAVMSDPANTMRGSRITHKSVANMQNRENSFMLLFYASTFGGGCYRSIDCWNI